jgi:hypothetical protein
MVEDPTLRPVTLRRCTPGADANLGCQWKELPIAKDVDGRPEIHYTRIYGAFRRWQAGGCFDVIFITVVLRLHQTMDALKTCLCPILEVHISNVHQREDFRHHSYVSLAATAVMAGFGTHGYQLALRHVAHLMGCKK